MADTYDVLTIAEARTAVSLGTNTDFDAPLAAAVTAVSRQLDQMCGPVVARTVTAETHDGGQPAIRLRRIPVHTITTVTSYSGITATTLTAETNTTTKTGNDYLHDGTVDTIRSGLIRRRSNGVDIDFTAGRRNIAVTYDTGRYATTATVDARFKQAGAMMLRHIWTGEQASGVDTFGQFTDPTINPLYGPGVLNKVAALLSGELLDGVYIG